MKTLQNDIKNKMKTSMQRIPSHNLSLIRGGNMESGGLTAKIGDIK